MRWLASIALGIIVLVVVLAAAAGLAVWHSVTSGLSDQIAAEALDAGGASLLISLVSGGVAIAAYAQATRSPRLQLSTTINADYFDAAGILELETKTVGTATDVSLQLSQLQWTKPGPTLLITLKNERSVAAVHPAVRVTLMDFEITTALQVNQDPWVHMRTPTGASFAFAWQWSGVDITVAGPNWEASLPLLTLAGSKPKTGVAPMIEISAVADGADAVRQTIRVAPD